MTLTEISYYTRRFIPFAIVGFFSFVLFYFLIKLSLPILFPPAPKILPISPVFGKLPQILIEDKIDYPSGAELVLDTIAGRPETATATAQVLPLAKKTTRFGYLETIYLMAKNLDFATETVEPVREDEVTLTFEDREKKLTVDIQNFNFEYEYSFKNDPGLFEEVILQSERQIKEDAKRFLRNIGRYPEELAQGRDNLIYLKYADGQFEVVETPKEANVVEVDFFRPDINGFPVVSPKYFNSQNFVVMVTKEYGFRVLKAQVKFFEKERSSRVGIYPLKSGDRAWEELIAGRGMIVSMGENNSKIIIRKMFLAYFDPDSFQPYLQPVYVFLGDGGFVAYVPAVTEEYIE